MAFIYQPLPFLPVHLLLSNRTEGQWTSYWKNCPGIITQNSQNPTPDFLQMVRSLTTQLQNTNAKRLILLNDNENQDRLLFLAGLLSGLVTGIPIVLPHSSTPGVLEELQQPSDFLTTGSTLEYPDVTSKESEIIDLFRNPAINPHKATITFFTSGSTGQAKPITKTLHQLEEEIHCLENLWGHRPNHRNQELCPTFCATVPHHHIYGLLFSLLWPVCAGYPLRRQTLHFWEDIVNTCPHGDILISSPSHLNRFPPALKASSFLKLNRVFSSGSPLPYDAAQTTAKHLGALPLEIYGSTETGGIAYRQQDQSDELAQKPWTPFPQMNIQTDENKCLQLQSPYLPRDTFFQTQDKIDYQPNHTFFLMGRADRIVKIEGKRLSLDELERNLIALPEIQKAKIIPLESSLLESSKTEIGAVVALSSDGKGLLKTMGKGRFNLHLRQCLKSTCELVVIPKKWRFVESIPQNNQGKTPLSLLQDLFIQNDESASSAEGKITMTHKTLNANRHPEILSHHEEENLIELILRIPENLAYLEGHFDNSPLVPGVVQLHWAIIYGNKYFHLNPTTDDLRVHQASQIKFSHPILPNQQIKLVLTHSPDKKTINFNYKIHNTETVCSSGRFHYTLPSLENPIMTYKLAALIPSHNHFKALPQIIDHLDSLKIPVFIVDDGSSEETRNALDTLSKERPTVSLLHLTPNRGKGYAVLQGFKWLYDQGYTHALQVDADGQHSLETLETFLRISRLNPQVLVSGQPIYNESAPKMRRFGRWFTHVWVWIETLSFRITDSMCGLRIYPIQKSIQIMKSNAIGYHMEFDTGLMVHHHWKGTPIIMIPIDVNYPEGNTSNFDMIKDNWRITKMHTHLFFLMLWRLPSILRNRPNYKDLTLPQETIYWASLDERGSLMGLFFLAKCYQLFGKKLCTLIGMPVVLFHYLMGTTQRQSSKSYLTRVFARISPPKKPGLKESFRHYMSFFEMVLDKFAAWIGHLKFEHIQFKGELDFKKIMTENQGGMLLVSHLGNMEFCRAAVQADHRSRLHVLLHTKNSQRFNRLLQAFNPLSNINILEVTEIDPGTLIFLKERIAQGDWVVIAGDRIPVTKSERVTFVPFLGKDAPFSQGPYILASLLECPVYTAIAVRTGTNFQVYIDAFADKISLHRATRTTDIEEYTKKYSAVLEKYVLMYPYQWFNFFDFWQENPHIKK